MSENVEYLDLEDLLALATVLLGQAPPMRDMGLLGSAVARPRTTAFGADAYPDIWTKAAALLLGLEVDEMTSSNLKQWFRLATRRCGSI